MLERKYRGRVCARVATLEMDSHRYGVLVRKVGWKMEKGSRLHELGTTALEELVLRGRLLGP